ncbi:MAG: DUF6922 domain-containing protein [Desulfitobacteriaceae bacterium]
MNKALFWDVKMDEIDPIKHKKWLIKRVVQWGSLEDIQSILKLFALSEIIEIVRSKNQPKIRES